jgi:hypothetical protein
LLYQVAAFVADENVRDFAGRGEGVVVRAAARAGRALLTIGQKYARMEGHDDERCEAVLDMGEGEVMLNAQEVVAECRAAGGMLDAIAHLVEAGATTEIITAKYALCLYSCDDTDILFCL